MSECISQEISDQVKKGMVNIFTKFSSIHPLNHLMMYIHIETLL
jgi:hypothetical protein